MKYVVILCDGMADLSIDSLGGRTPMQAAKKPTIDRLAEKATVGMVRTVANGMKPGSDVANLSVMGFDPAEVYTGRSPLEAASIGIDLNDDAISSPFLTSPNMRKRQWSTTVAEIFQPPKQMN